jgi:hypothetical protein
MMNAPGETDLDAMLASLGVTRRPGVFTFVEVAELDADLVTAAEAVIREDESITLVLAVDAAQRVDLPVVVEMAWLSLTVNSSLEAVGLTAAFSRILGDEGISCNVLAGYHHDHLLVPVDRADEAIAVLTVSSD